jgi:hypothetical protein
MECVKTYTEEIQIYYVVSKPRPTVSSRDISYLLVKLPLGDSTFAMVGTSVEAGIPPRENTVRAELITALHLFEPIGGDATKCHY